MCTVDESAYGVKAVARYRTPKWAGVSRSRFRLTVLSSVFMFTGIIEHLGTVESLALRDDGGRVTIHAPTLNSKMAVSNSIAVNGCCLTIASVDNDRFSADLSGETVRKTSFGADAGPLQKGSRVNLEHPLTTGKHTRCEFQRNLGATSCKKVRLRSTVSV
jgi:hypothetical protein